MAATRLRNAKSGLLLAALLTASMWFYVERVMIPQQVSAAATQGSPRGNLSDLYPRWLAARELLLHHRDPYSPELTREIQIGYYGRALDPSRPGDPKDQQAFAYPVYVVFLMAPAVGFPFSAAQEAFRWLLLILSAALIPLWLRVFRWRPSGTVTAILVILTLGFFPVVQGLKLQQLSLAVSGLIAGCVVMLAGGHFLLAGILLALATVKPHLVLLLAPWLVLWACSDLRQRRGFLIGFLGTMALLLGGAEWILPGWMGSFLKALQAYREYTGRPLSVLGTVTTPVVGTVLTVFVLIGLGFAGWRARRAQIDAPAFAVLCSLLLAATVVTIPMTALYNQALLLPAILLLARNIAFFRTKDAFTRAAILVAALVFAWPWLAALTLTGLSVLLPAAEVQKVWSAPLWSSMMTPVVVLLLLVPLASSVLQERR